MAAAHQEPQVAFDVEGALAATFDEFTKKFLQANLTINESNLVVCPIGALTSLAAIFQGSNNDLTETLATFLAIPGNPAQRLELFRALNHVVNSLNEFNERVYNNDLNDFSSSSSDSATTTSSLSFLQETVVVTKHKLYYHHELEVEDQFLDNLRLFNSNPEELNFSVRSAADTINKWVEVVTRSRVTDMVTEDDFGNNTSVVCVNPNVYDAVLSAQFKPIKENLAFFVNENHEEMVSYLETTARVWVREDVDMDCKFVQLSYMEKSLKLMLVLPNQRDGLENLTNLICTKSVAEIMSLGTSAFTRIVVPSFKLVSQINLATCCETMGLTEPFSPLVADFSRMSQDLPWISNYLQKSSFELAKHPDLEQVGNTKHRRELIFNHPFLFFVVYQQRYVVICGKVGNPQIISA